MTQYQQFGDERALDSKESLQIWEVMYWILRVALQKKLYSLMSVITRTFWLSMRSVFELLAVDAHLHYYDATQRARGLEREEHQQRQEQNTESSHCLPHIHNTCGTSTNRFFPGPGEVLCAVSGPVSYQRVTHHTGVRGNRVHSAVAINPDAAIIRVTQSTAETCFANRIQPSPDTSILALPPRVSAELVVTIAGVGDLCSSIGIVDITFNLTHLNADSTAPSNAFRVRAIPVVHFSAADADSGVLWPEDMIVKAGVAGNGVKAVPLLHQFTIADAIQRATVIDIIIILYGDCDLHPSLDDVGCDWVQDEGEGLVGLSLVIAKDLEFEAVYRITYGVSRDCQGGSHWFKVYSTCCAV